MTFCCWLAPLGTILLTVTAPLPGPQPIPTDAPPTRITTNAALDAMQPPVSIVSFSPPVVNCDWSHARPRPSLEDRELPVQQCEGAVALGGPRVPVVVREPLQPGESRGGESAQDQGVPAGGVRVGHHGPEGAIAERPRVRHR